MAFTATTFKPSQDWERAPQQAMAFANGIANEPHGTGWHQGLQGDIAIPKLANYQIYYSKTYDFARFLGFRISPDSLD